MIPRAKYLAASLACVLALSNIKASTQEAAAAQGLIRTELSLTSHLVTVTYSPTIRSEGLPSATSSAARARVAQLTTTKGVLRIGTLEMPPATPPAQQHDLWLAKTPDGWRLQVAAVSKPPAQPTVIGEVPLSVRTSATSSPFFTATLSPVSDTGAQLMLRWAGNEATADLKFVDQPVKRGRHSEEDAPNVGVERGNFADTTEYSIAQFLAQNNESSIVLPNGKRLSASFLITRSGTAAPLGREARLFSTRGLPAGGPDYTKMASVADGGVVELTQSHVPRLKIETPLRFGAVTIRTENHVGGYPGLYSIWLKRAGAGWKLVLNNEYDVWGTQYDRKFDVAQIELSQTERPDQASRPFGIALVPTAADRGRLVIIWGPHEWSADFAIATAG